LEEVRPNKIIMNDSSPIRLRLKLKCENCKKQMKLSYCKSLVNVKAIDCPHCEKSGEWSIQDIECNFTLWGGGVKIDNHEHL
jgi:hypothetical protein